MKLFHLGLCVAEYPHDGLRRGLMQNCSSYYELNCGSADVNQRAQAICGDFRPDLVFMQVQAANVISSETARLMRAGGAFVMNWTGDVRNEVPAWMAELNKDVSVTCFSNMRDVRALPGSEYLEIGYDPEVFRPDGHQLPVRPVVFFGNHYGDQFPMGRFRAEMVNYMKARFDFGVYGNYPGASGTFNHSQLDESAAYRNAKVAINCSHYEIERYSSDRLLRILGTGGAVCLAKAYPGIPFTDGEHLRIWRTLEELASLTNYYLDPENDWERRGIAARGQEYALEHFSYAAMGRNIVEIYNRRKPKQV